VLRKGQQMVTVRQELEFVENFIRIQRIRFPNRFSYVYQAEEDCMSALIPPLLIENFVENAIKYALNPKEPIEIVVSVHREENEAGKATLHIAIMDTGSGIRPEVLEKLQKREPYIDEAGQKHIGIYNCLRRVELFYGDEGDIHFSSAVGGGTQVYLIIPFSLSAERDAGKETRA
jgi:sensor histidine kinase YesM